MDRDFQASLRRALADPTIYPHKVTKISRRETHISLVYLTGDYVYKIKKPVDLGFVDFSSLEKRRAFCEQEVRLNRRLTSGIYLAVVPILWNGKEIQLKGTGEAVEYAVQMRQLSSARTMDRLLATGAIADADVERLAAKLVAFHDSTLTVRDQPICAFVKAACDENFLQVAPYENILLSAGQLDTVRRATYTVLELQQGLFNKRTISGKIRDGHGDLRSEHVYYAEDGKIQILDCLEFNDRLRTVDVASDLAFLAMDLEYLNRTRLSRLFLESYCRKAGDASLLGLMSFYQCYRAMVRCKVNCIRYTDPGLSQHEQNGLAADARRYLRMARRYAQRMTRPTLWIVCGLPASGKSSVSRGLAEALDIAVLNSDRVRKQLCGLSPRVYTAGPVDEGIYAAEISQQVYEELLNTARKQIGAGRSFILDATYSLSIHRQKLLQLADECRADIYFVECIADEKVLRDRLRKRDQGQPVSDARLVHFEILRTRFEPLNDIPPISRIRLDTTADGADCLNSLFIERYLYREQGIIPPANSN